MAATSRLDGIDVANQIGDGHVGRGQLLHVAVVGREISNRRIVAESRNFPEIARFYTDEVAAPTHELLATALRRGIESGHFRRVDVESFVQMLIAPMLSLALWRHSLVACSVMEIDIDAYHDTYMGTILRALEPERTAARQTAQNEA